MPFGVNLLLITIGQATKNMDIIENI